MANKKNLIELASIAVFLMFGFIFAANATTTGTEFAALATRITNWATGSLGLVMSLVGFLVGVGIGAAKQNFLPPALGVLFAVVLQMGPGLLRSVFSAVI